MEIYLLGYVIAFIISIVSTILEAYNKHSDIYVSDVFKCFCTALFSWGLVALLVFVLIIIIGCEIGKLPIWKWKGK